ncbi:MAG TPA: S8 family serine peptidase, partial [Acidimicrobiales bacterium]|nr:S8 family serine peptidase [Acidimicrobiales bacterium]
MAGVEEVKRDPRAVLVRLLVQLEHGGPEGETGLAAAVAAGLGRDADGCWWQVRPMFPPDDDPVAGLDRFFEVEGRVGPSRFPPERVAWDLARRLAAATGAHVEPDLPSAAFEPEDPAVPGVATREGFGRGETPRSDDRAWGLKAVRAPQAWALEPPPGGARRGAGILIGHPDSGYTDHPELAGVYDLTRDRDVMNGDDDARDPLTPNHIPIDSRGHGTATATTIASREAGEVAGVAPDARLVPIRAVNSVVQVFDRDLAKAVDHARRVGCHVISMSVGGTGFLGLRAAIRRAVDGGVIVLAAAGNNVRFVVAPASYPEVIAVGATNVDDRPWSGSSRGGKVAVCGPGGNVWTSGWDLDVSPPVAKVNLHSGTSFGVAHAAGAAALWLAFHGRDRLIERVGRANVQAAFLHCLRRAGHRRPDPWDPKAYGVGIVDVEALLKAPLPDRADVAPRAAVPAGPLVEDPLERLQRVVPELTAAELEAALGRMLGVAPE